jgi:hypothetical protein
MPARRKTSSRPARNDALRLCHDEAMSQDDACISKCIKAHERLVSARCLALAKKYKKI